MAVHQAVVHALCRIVHLLHEQFDRLQGPVTGSTKAKNSVRLEQRGDYHAVPARINRLIHKRRRTFPACLEHLRLCARKQLMHLLGCQARTGGDGCDGLVDEEHVFGRIVVHLARSFHLVILRSDVSFLPAEHGLQFVQCPREVITVVLQTVVGVLARVESALRVGQYVFNEENDSQGDFAEKLILGQLVSVNIVQQ